MTDKPKHIIEMTLPDIRIVDPSCLKGKFVHLDIENDNLIITLDWDNGQFGIATALQLQGMKIDKALLASKKILQMEAKKARKELENFK